MSKIKEYSNKIINTGTAYIKIGKITDQEDIAGYFCELIDFVGNFKGSFFKIDDKCYFILGYGEFLVAEKNLEVTEEAFNKRLAETIIDLAVNPPGDAFQLPFKRTEERIGMYKVLVSKSPKIIFGNDHESGC